jgi:hypothetical protein
LRRIRAERNFNWQRPINNEQERIADFKVDDKNVVVREKLGELLSIKV